METKATDLTELFGSMVFNEDAMRQYLSSNSFRAPPISPTGSSP